MKDPCKNIMAILIAVLCLCITVPLEAEEESLVSKGQGLSPYEYGNTETSFLPLAFEENLLVSVNMEFGSSENSMGMDHLYEEQSEEVLPSVLGYAMYYQPQSELAFTLNFLYFPERDHNEDSLKGRIPADIYPGTFLYEAWNKGGNLPTIYSGRVAWLAEGSLVGRLNMIYSRWSTVDTASDSFAAPTEEGLFFRDTLGLALGLQYDLNPLMTIYADYIYDPSPYSNWPGFPEEDLGRHILHFGSGFTSSNLRIDLSYSYTLLSSEKGPEEGESSLELNDREILEINLQYRF